MDPANQPTQQPSAHMDEPFLQEQDLPPDSFVEASGPSDVSEVREELASSQTQFSPLSVQQSASPVQSTRAEGPSTTSAPQEELESPQPCSSSPLVHNSTSPVHPSRNRSTILPTIAEEDSSHEVDAGPASSNIYPAEQIVCHRIRNGRPQFLIKWSGFSDSHNSWEPRENIMDDRLFKRYFRTRPRAKRLLETDPDFNPRVATLSWTEPAHKVPILAVLSPLSIPKCQETVASTFSRPKEVWTRSYRGESSVAWDQENPPLVTNRTLLVTRPQSSFRTSC